MNVLTISNLNKRYDSVEALSDFSLEVPSGVVLGLLGPNGAGKTTLLRIINGILSKDSGDVKILGNDANLKTARKVGYMPEERGLYDNMTVADQIVYFGQLKGGDPARLREVMREYLSLFNIESFENRKVKELSKGNQQKVQISLHSYMSRIWLYLMSPSVVLILSTALSCNNSLISSISKERLSFYRLITCTLLRRCVIQLR